MGFSYGQPPGSQPQSGASPGSTGGAACQDPLHQGSNPVERRDGSRRALCAADTARPLAVSMSTRGWATLSGRLGPVRPVKGQGPALLGSCQTAKPFLVAGTGQAWHAQQRSHCCSGTHTPEKSSRKRMPRLAGPFPQSSHSSHPPLTLMGAPWAARRVSQWEPLWKRELKEDISLITSNCKGCNSSETRTYVFYSHSLKCVKY